MMYEDESCASPAAAATPTHSSFIGRAFLYALCWHRCWGAARENIRHDCIKLIDFEPSRLLTLRGRKISARGRERERERE